MEDTGTHISVHGPNSALVGGAMPLQSNGTNRFLASLAFEFMLPTGVGVATVEVMSIEGILLEATPVRLITEAVTIDPGVGVLTARSVSRTFGVLSPGQCRRQTVL